MHADTKYIIITIIIIIIIIIITIIIKTLLLCQKALAEGRSPLD